MLLKRWQVARAHAGAADFYRKFSLPGCRSVLYDNKSCSSVVRRGVRSAVETRNVTARCKWCCVNGTRDPVIKSVNIGKQ